jgi:hypothetical protein
LKSARHARIGGYHPLVTFGLAVHPANAGLNIMSPLSYSYFRKGGQAVHPGNVGWCMFPFAKAFVTGFA